jgi:hypothetical protein
VCLLQLPFTKESNQALGEKALAAPATPLVPQVIPSFVHFARFERLNYLADQLPNPAHGAGAHEET